jgi:universal stress protein A
MRYKHVLAAVDINEDPKLVLNQAAEMADLNGSRLSVIYALEDVTHPYGDSFTPNETYSLLLSGGLKRSKERLDELSAQYGVLGGDCHVSYESWPPRAIRKLAKKVKADLIVVGTHGRKGVKKILLGSTASGVLQGIGCDVLSVRIK